MNTNDARYARFALVREMLETVRVVRGFDPRAAESFCDEIGPSAADALYLLSGEGSSRIFPAKNSRAAALRRGGRPRIETEGSTQALEYELDRSVVFGASNSGRTKEILRLFRTLRKRARLFALTANTATPLEDLADRTYVLSCGPEAAVAATKSVMEQALFYDAFFNNLRGSGRQASFYKDLADGIEACLKLPVPAELVKAAAQARTLYFSGRNDGAAEELSLKTNEITRKPSAFLEGTYAVHGIEEVMDAEDLVVLIEPFADEEAKFKEVLEDGVGMPVWAVSSRPTIFPALTVPDFAEAAPFLHLAAGWKLLVETAIELDIDLDRPKRARKIGNEG